MKTTYQWFGVSCNIVFNCNRITNICVEHVVHISCDLRRTAFLS